MNIKKVETKWVLLEHIDIGQFFILETTSDEIWQKAANRNIAGLPQESVTVLVYNQNEPAPLISSLASHTLVLPKNVDLTVEIL